MSGSRKIGIIGGAGWLGVAIASSLIKAGAVSESDLSFRSRRPAGERLARLNAALKSIKADGTYDMINAKYFPFSIQ